MVSNHFTGNFFNFLKRGEIVYWIYMEDRGKRERGRSSLCFLLGFYNFLKTALNIHTLSFITCLFYVYIFLFILFNAIAFNYLLTYFIISNPSSIPSFNLGQIQVLIWDRYKFTTESESIVEICMKPQDIVYCLCS